MVKLLILLLLNTTPSSANATLSSALDAYEKGQFDVAHNSFLELSGQNQYKFLSFYNLGNIAAKQKKAGEALAYYRKAKKYKPRDSALNFNIQFVLSQFQIPPATGNIETFEVLRQEILSKFSFYEMSILSFIFLVLFSFYLVSYLKRRATQEEAPPFPAKLIPMGLLLILCASLMTLKIIDSYTTRATIITKSDLKSGPSDTHAALTEVNEGIEVFVLNTSGPWKQVSVPGNLTGWIADKNLIETSGGGPW